MSTIALDESYSEPDRVLTGARYEELSPLGGSALERDKQEGQLLATD